MRESTKQLHQITGLLSAQVPEFSWASCCALGLQVAEFNWASCCA